MNTNGLARHYDKLTPRERFPLIVAATARDDKQECDRLIDSAPKIGWRLPDYYGLGDALQDLGLVFMLELLNLVAQYWHADGVLESYALSPKTKKDKTLEDRLHGMLKLLAYLFVVNLDAWKQLLTELQMAPDFLFMGMPGHDALRRFEPLARIMAFTKEEAAAYLNKTRRNKSGKTKAETGGEVVEVVPITVESEIADMRKFLSDREAKWS